MSEETAAPGGKGCLARGCAVQRAVALLCYLTTGKLCAFHSRIPSARPFTFL